MKNYHSIIPAVYLILREQDRILLLKRANTGYMDGFYSLPAGHIEMNESAKMAAIREAKEETGINIMSEDLSLAHIIYRKQDDRERLDMFFNVTGYSGAIKNMEPEKCDELDWYHIDKLPENIIPDLRKALENIASGKIYSELNY